MNNIKKGEVEFENELIEYLSNLGGVKQWEYLPHIKTTEGLWDNFKSILTKNNPVLLDNPLTNTEFQQIKDEINKIDTPYRAGQFLYGINGSSKLDILRDNGDTLFLEIFNQANVGAGGTLYQVVNQIERPKIVEGRQDRRFDVTLLINGLPIIQIELKKNNHSANEAINQMQQYIKEKQYSGIYSTTQILIAMTEFEIRYMANTTFENFNKSFVFQWQDQDSKPVVNWRDFANKVLSIPMAHELATRFMILDGTPNKEMIKVMRPYQVYATQRVLEKIRNHDFKYDDGRLGYIWHTTGSGKTITSFKTAWLASKESNVDKVVFLVDRIALTNQTARAYAAYDQDLNSSDGGVVLDTASVRELKKKLNNKSNQRIIVTSIHKMAKLAKRDDFKLKDTNILFIVDEAHRSTGGSKFNKLPLQDDENEGMLKTIRNKLPRSAWIGYTGTPKFPQTEEIFGPSLHEYTIKEAIADRNVLGFKVEFKETISPDISEEVNFEKASIYDTDENHVQLVVKDILHGWNNRSSNKKYNALFTVGVTGAISSIPRVLEYYDEFQRQMSELPENKRIKIGVSYSLVSSNKDYQEKANSGLLSIIQNYNKKFKTNFGLDTIKEYTEDLTSRLNKTHPDKNYLDLVIVIDQLLTGFDAPELNALYIDRNLRDSNLIQAYSRTNRVHDFITKPYGNIVNYRFPKENEKEMNRAFAIYSNKDYANQPFDDEEAKDDNKDSGVIAKEYKEVIKELKDVVVKIDKLTDNFTKVPDSEGEMIELSKSLSNYNSLINKASQFPYDEKTKQGFPSHNPELFHNEIGLSVEEELRLFTSITQELNKRLKESENIEWTLIPMEMMHITEIRINYDYLAKLIADMANQVYRNEPEALSTKEQIINELNKLENENERDRMLRFIEKVFNKEFKFDHYPVKEDTNIIEDAVKRSESRRYNRLISEFIHRMGVIKVITVSDVDEVIGSFRIHNKLNSYSVNDLAKKARSVYKEYADENVSKLSWIEYIVLFREELEVLAKKLKEV